MAMESTGVYWIPIFDVLQRAGIEVFLVNAYHVKSVTGRKTDLQDCQWLQKLHGCGLLKGSFRPDDLTVAVRSLFRHHRHTTGIHIANPHRFRHYAEFRTMPSNSPSH